MTAEELTKIMSEMDKDVLDATMASDSKTRSEALQRALRNACGAMRFVFRELTYFLDNDLEDYKTGALSVATLVENPEKGQENDFRIFRTRKEFHDFTDTLANLSAAAGVTQKEVNRVVVECRVEFAAMRANIVNSGKFKRALARLKNFFCPRDGGTFDPNARRPIHPTPSFLKYMEKAITTLASIAGIVSLGLQLQAGTVKPPSTDKPSPPVPERVPYYLKLLATLLAVTLITWLENTGLVEIEVESDLDPEGGTMQKEEEKRELVEAEGELDYA